MMQFNNRSGFTLIELLVVMVIAGMLLGVMVMAFTGQSRSYNSQQDISRLQEDMSAALQLMSRDFHMAGYDPTTKAAPLTLPIPNQFIIAADATHFHALQDINGNGAFLPATTAANPDENILYSFVTPAAGSTASLMRSSNGGAAQPLVDNLTQVGFDYMLITKNGNDPWTWAWTTAPTAADLPNIRVVKVCMQGRTARQVQESTVKDTSSFNPPLSNAPDWTPSAATVGMFQFRTVCIEVQCRNFID
jgi:prepilin-type N-terminal cleavage/methylation domain-containing protein